MEGGPPGKAALAPIADCVIVVMTFSPLVISGQDDPPAAANSCAEQLRALYIAQTCLIIDQLKVHL